MVIVALCACGTPTTTTPATNTATTQANTTPLPPVPTGAPTESVTITTQNFVVWFPESLAPSDRPEIAALLDEQLNGFINEQDQPITIEFRLRRYADIGGILSALRTANKVAPNGLPDVTLVRLEDLRLLIQDGLALPLEGHLSSSIMGDLFPPALQSGRIQNQLYAIPYVLEIQLLAYYGDENQPTSWLFDTILSSEAFWNFPAGRTTGLNNTVFLQYLSAGGTINDGVLGFNRDALEIVLTYYEQARERGLIDETMLNFVSSSDYLRNLTSGDLRAGVINSTAFLEALGDETPLLPVSIPTDKEDNLTSLSSWVWIVTAKTAEHQTVAFTFIDWMMENNRQAEYAQLIHMLPSQRGALTLMNLDTPLTTLFSDMLTNAVVPPTDNNTGTLARAIQSAFISVISGDTNAQEAVDSVASQFGE
ncbi:MAG: extracellular solute-binding protein [bacterium]|nr:extracellular solute-binding protein [bacterium]